MADAVYEQLRGAISRADLPPNQRLVEGEIAGRLQVSRTPVREALVRLEQEGLVVRDHGWIVKDISLAYARAMIEARSGIESIAARLAATRISREQITQLHDLHNSMDDPLLSRIEFNRLNDRFHATITNAAANPILVAFEDQTRLNYWNLRIPVEFTREDDVMVRRDHLALIQALEDGNAWLAESIARAHVDSTMRIVLQAMGDFR